MNKTQSSILNSFDTTNLVLGNYELVWTGSTAFAEIVNDMFRPTLSNIKIFKQAQEIDIRGVRENKLAKQQSMADKSFKISGALQALASKNQDKNLYRKAYSPAELMNGREENCVDKARIIENAARKNVAALAPYGVVLADVDSFLASIDAFEKSIPEPDNAINAKKDATRNLKTLFPKGRNIIETSMKKAAAQYKENAPEFFARLMDSFDIKDLPTQHTDIDFIIVEKNTKSALPGVKVTAVPVKNPKTVLNQFSNMEGEADYNAISPEMYNVTFELPDHETVTKVVEAERGKKLELTVEMARLAVN
jgi:hypothetical protein